MPEAQKGFIITGPTSGYGHRTARELARHGTVILVGRDPGKLSAVKGEIERTGGNAVVVQCDLSDLASVRRAAAQIAALDIPLVGLVNNAGIRQAQPKKNARGWVHINAVEPGVSPATNLGNDANAVMKFIARSVVALLVGRVRFLTTPERAAKVITNAVLNPAGVTGVYFDEKGEPMWGSKEVSDPAFQDRVVAEIRALLKGR